MDKYSIVEPQVVVHTTGGSTLTFEVSPAETTIRFNGAEIAHVCSIDLALAMAHVVDQIKRAVKGRDDVIAMDEMFSVLKEDNDENTAEQK